MSLGMLFCVLGRGEKGFSGKHRETGHQTRNTCERTDDVIRCSVRKAGALKGLLGHLHKNYHTEKIHSVIIKYACIRVFRMIC